MYHQLKTQNFDSFEPLKSSPPFLSPQKNDPSPNGAQTAASAPPRLVSDGLLKRVGPEELLEEAVSTSGPVRQEIDVKGTETNKQLFRKNHRFLAEKPTFVLFGKNVVMWHEFFLDRKYIYSMCWALEGGVFFWVFFANVCCGLMYYMSYTKLFLSCGSHQGYISHKPNTTLAAECEGKQSQSPSFIDTYVFVKYNMYI